ncbi:late histone H2B.L4-like [Venturia canescens]|uniref:late histone H2B.L4-like n=1 Tax=Venturia canescens TaxID=32260 RepID=UPI001C9C0629|nr:late histone H2B.L4-like [Venturia canescens]
MKRGSKTSASRSRRKKKMKQPSYASYVYRILKEIDPMRGISSKALAIMDHFAKDIFDRCAVEAARTCCSAFLNPEQHKTHARRFVALFFLLRLTKLNAKRTMTANEVRTAVRLLLPDHLGSNAVLQGNNALDMYNETSNRCAQ